MRSPTDKELVGLLVRIINDGFNRSLGALEAAGAVSSKKMRSQYRGIGSEYYDLVTEQMVLTATYGVPGIRKLFEETDGTVTEK